jgi:hypothetical protein
MKVRISGSEAERLIQGQFDHITQLRTQLHTANAQIDILRAALDRITQLAQDTIRRRGV